MSIQTDAVGLRCFSTWKSQIAADHHRKDLSSTAHNVYSVTLDAPTCSTSGRLFTTSLHFHLR